MNDNFEESGLSANTIVTLIDEGFTRPEELLSMSEEQIKNIRGIGPVRFAEIKAYVARNKRAEPID